MHVQHLRGLRAGGGQGPVLVVIVASTRAATSSVISCSSRLRSAGLQLAGAHHPVEQDLDVDLVVGGVNAGRVVDEVGVHQAARQGVLDPGRLGQAQVPALGDDPGAQVGGIHPDRVGGPSPASACDWALAFTQVPMPPFHSRSTGADKIAEMS